MNTHTHTHTYIKTESQGAAREKDCAEVKRYTQRETKLFFSKNGNSSKSTAFKNTLLSLEF